LAQSRFADVEQMIHHLATDKEGTPLSLILRARLHLSQHAPALAFNSMRQAISLAPLDVWMRIVFSDMLVRQEDLRGEAEEQLLEVLRIDPTHLRASRKLKQLRNREQADFAN
jgi:hypothetical protein